MPEVCSRRGRADLFAETRGRIGPAWTRGNDLFRRLAREGFTWPYWCQLAEIGSQPVASTDVTMVVQNQMSHGGEKLIRLLFPQGDFDVLHGRRCARS